MFLQFQGKIPDEHVILLQPPCNLHQDYMDATQSNSRISNNGWHECSDRDETIATKGWSLYYILDYKAW